MLIRPNILTISIFRIANVLNMLIQKLYNLLHIFSCDNSNVGYIQGMNFILKYDYFDHNYNYMTDSMTRISYGFEVFPLNFLELKFQIRTHKSESFDFDEEYLIQVHTWF